MNNLKHLKASHVLKRVEPPHWWAGMYIKKFQLLFYGDHISEYTITCSSDLNILQVEKTQNSNYLFVTLDTSEIQAGMYSFSFQKENLPEFTISYAFKSRVEDSANRTSFDSSDVFYLLMPDRFAHANPLINSVKQLSEKANPYDLNGRHGGDILGIINNLDYLKDLGITTLWCTPLCENNSATGSYHGYAQTDLYKIDARLGTLADYKKLSRELHKRNMRLVIDYVINHWGSEHWLIKDLPNEGWLNQWEHFTNTTHKTTTLIDMNASVFDKDQHEKGWFVSTMPDLNQQNPLVLNYLIQNAIWWIEEAGLDGVRVDTFTYSDKEAAVKWLQAIKAEYPNLNIAGEVWLHNSAQLAYWQKDSKIGQMANYNSQLPCLTDFPLHNALQDIFYAKHKKVKGLESLYETFVNDFFYPSPQNLMRFIENHDTQRFNTQSGGDLNAYKLALTVICTTRGIPQLYYGSEIGMQGDKSNGDGDIRHEFPGGWKKHKQNAFLPLTVKNGRSAYQERFHAFTKKLLNWRKDKPVVHYGKFLHFVPVDNVYVYFRYLGEEKRVMVIINNAKTKKILALQKFAEGLNGSKAGNEILSNQILDLSTKLSVPARTPYIIELT
ncbi:alpha-amylase family glycosyl hydrolase [Leeuwenhoekiella polynyae]|uniref:Glycosidase n=1 Tax=Leeuwenhoekiella polynyae TaxID=1550906 RepID=A0A4Q0P1G1_9FLAO|nr:alpha-amylase family glycosyl hydrolase [Leeuwenhoekiella polynyae]RXG20247.1 glycosidase [Leeuwenhoekiella polynyae]